MIQLVDNRTDAELRSVQRSDEVSGCNITTVSSPGFPLLRLRPRDNGTL
jgi:hypothetical protein